jgi:hypothetical protein
MATHCSSFQSRLSLLADGELPPAETTEVRAHLASCADCRGLLADVQQLRTAARDLGPIAPPDHAWMQIAGPIRLGAEKPLAAPVPVRTVAANPTWQWIGLAAALVLVALGVYMFRSGAETPSTIAETGAGNAGTTASVEAVTAELGLAMAHYEKAVSELERIAKTDDTSLDPLVAATLKRNIGVIDVAIAESRTALQESPASAPARESLFAALRQKISVLQTTVLLINQIRKGDYEGAARVAGAGKKS